MNVTWHKRDNGNWFATDFCGLHAGTVELDGKEWVGKLRDEWVGTYGTQKEAKACVEGAYRKVALDAQRQRQKEEEEAEAATAKARKRAKAVGYTLKREGRWFWLKSANGWHSAHQAAPPGYGSSSPTGFPLSKLLEVLKEEEDKVQEEVQDERERLEALAILDEMACQRCNTH